LAAEADPRAASAIRRVWPGRAPRDRDDTRRPRHGRLSARRGTRRPAPHRGARGAEPAAAHQPRSGVVPRAAAVTAGAAEADPH
jgi:hypothetical protein